MTQPDEGTQTGMRYDESVKIAYGFGDISYVLRGFEHHPWSGCKVFVHENLESEWVLVAMPRKLAARKFPEYLQDAAHS